MGRVLCLGLVWGLVCTNARAQEQGDLETARRHFEIGAQRYDAGDYRHALDEFLTAQRLYRVPAFDFNIGRCYDKLDETQLAIEHYEHYVATQPADAAAVQARIVELKHKLDLLRPPPEHPRTKRKTLAIVLGVLGGAVVAGTAVALGVALSRSPDYSSSTLGPMRVTP